MYDFTVIDKRKFFCEINVGDDGTWSLIDYAKLIIVDRLNSKTRQHWRTIRQQLKWRFRGCGSARGGGSPTEIESINSLNERFYFIPRSLRLQLQSRTNLISQFAQCAVIYKTFYIYLRSHAFTFRHCAPAFAISFERYS